MMTKKTFPRTKKIRRTAASIGTLTAMLGLAGLLVFSPSCVNDIESQTPSTAETVEAVDEPAENEFEAEVRAFRDADYDYIFSFRRKDGKPMNAEDKRFVKENSHFNTNRFTLTEDETVIFAGSNFKFEKKGLEALKKRFEVRDFSKPEHVIENRRKEAKEAKEETKAGAKAKR